MITNHTPFDAEGMLKELEGFGVERLRQYTNGLDSLIAAREQQAQHLEASLRKNEWLKQHANDLERFGSNLNKARQQQVAGRLSRAKAGDQLRQQWLSVSSAESFNRLAEIYSKDAPIPSGFEQRWLSGAFIGVDDALSEWETVTGLLGVRSLMPRMPNGDRINQLRPIPDPGDSDPGGPDPGDGDPNPGNPAPPPMSPTPVTRCNTPPFAFKMTSSQNTGLAELSSNPSVNTDTGLLTSDSSTFAPVLAGGGTDGLALVGTDVSWDAGFDTMSISADIDISFGSLFAVTIIGGASASAELILQATLSDGRDFRVGQALGSAVAPFIFQTNISVSGRRTISLGNINLNGAPGSVRVFTGVHDNTAAVGVVGSSAARTFITTAVKSICVRVS